MGIKNLHPFLRKTCPYVYSEVPLSNFAFQKIAIDTSIFICKFKTIAGSQWKDAFFQFIVGLRSLDVHPVFIFDTVFPMEKDLEKKQRIDARNRIKEKVLLLELSWSMFCQYFSKEMTTSQVDDDDDQEKQVEVYMNASEHLNKVLSTLRQRTPDGKFIFVESKDDVFSDWKWENHTEFKKFLQKLLTQEGYEQELTVVMIERELEKVRNSCFVVRTEDFLWTKQLLTVLGVPFFQAVGEAEATCAVLNKRQLVDAVLSEDTDVLAYGAPIFLHKINFQTMTVKCVYYQAVLEALEFMPSQFLDFCIMCGTDYNTNIPNVGPEKAYRYIKKCGNIEEMGQHYPKMDLSCLNYQRVRQLLDNTFNVSHFKIPFCNVPNRTQLKEFAFEHNLTVDGTLIEDTFFRSPHIEYPKEWTMQRSNSRSLTVVSLLRSDVISPTQE